MLNHKPYQEWMHQALDGELAREHRAEFDLHLAECADCQSLWQALTEAERLFDAPVMAAPRPGFTGRFKARVQEQHSRPRVLWGALILGFSSVGAAALVLPIGVSLAFAAFRVAQQPATTAALFSGATATAYWILALVQAGWIVGRALMGLALTTPLVAGVALGLIGVLTAWALVMRRYITRVLYL